MLSICSPNSYLFRKDDLFLVSWPSAESRLGPTWLTRITSSFILPPCSQNLTPPPPHFSCLSECFLSKKIQVKMHLLHFSFHFFSGHPLSPPSFSCHSIPFSISLQFSFPSSPSASFSLLLLHLHPPFLLPCMCKRRVEGVRDGGKAFACRKFFSPSVLTCSPAGQHILSTSVGLAGQAEPYLLSPPSFSLPLSWFIH